MLTLRLKPIGLTLLCLFAGGVAADDDAPQLKLAPALVPIPRANKDPTPLFVEADSLRGHQDKEIEAEGDARLRKRGKSVFADWLMYSKPDDEVTAVGNVRIEQYGDVMEGPRLRLNVVTDQGFMDQPLFQIPSNNGRGQAERLIFESEDKFRAINGSYTTCSIGQDDWYLRSSELQIDKGRDVGTARNAVIEFKGVPILYSPFLSFSLHQERKSGFLAPTLATSGKSGPEFTLPYYWNIAPNRDATIAPRYLAKRGLLIGSEFRYLEPSYRGEARMELLPNDRVRGGDNRGLLFLKHQQTLSYGWSGLLDIQKVSDDDYFRDLSTQVATTSLTTLQRTGMLSRGGGWWNGGYWGFSAVVQRWQTLQDPLAPVVPPYNRQPQLTLNAYKNDIYRTDFEALGSYVDFNHPSLPNGRRVVAYPSLSLPLQSSFGYLRPKIGLHVSQYFLDKATTALPDSSRSVPIFSTESGLVLERNMSFQGERFLQTLEPKIYYVYIPTRNQSQIPNFESGVQDINFATIFSENQYSGNDRINDANQLTFGVTSRLLQPDTGIERLRVGVAQRYYFKSQEVTLPGEIPRDSNSSDLLAAISGTVARNLVAEAGWQYRTSTSQTQKLSAGVRYLPEPGKVLNAGYRFTRDSIEQVDVSAQWPIRGGWAGVGRWNYSLRDSKVIEALAGFEYSAGCWAFRVVGHRIATATQDAITAVFLQLELNGVSKVGSNPLDVLKQNISGYTRLAPQPTGPIDYIPTR